MKKESKKAVFKFKTNSEFKINEEKLSCKDCMQTDCFYWLLYNKDENSYDK